MSISREASAFHNTYLFKPRHGTTQKVPPQRDIMRCKEKSSREREMHVHEILTDPKQLANRRKIIKYFCKYFSLLKVLVQISHIPLNLMAYY